MSGPATTVRPAAWPKSSALKADAAEDACNVLIVGVGGQGVIMVSKVLALLAQTQGFEVKQSEVHGMAKRGGSVFSHVRFGKRVWSPTIPKGEVDILVALEWAEGLRWLPFLKPGGIFICDTKRIVPPFACLNRHPGAPLRYSKETPAEVLAHVAEGYAIDATDMAEAARQRTRGERHSARRAVDGFGFCCRGLGAHRRRVRAEEDHCGQSGGVPPRPRLDRRGAQRHAAGGSAGERHRRQPRPPIDVASRDQSGLVQELRHLREDVSGALPAAECRAHRRTGRSRRNAPAAGCANGCVRISPSACISMREPLRREELAQ